MLTRFHASNLEHTVVSKTDTQGDWLHDMERVGLSQSAGRRCDPAAGESHRPTWEGATFMVHGPGIVQLHSVLHTPHPSCTPSLTSGSPLIAGATTLKALRIDCSSVDRRG